ncbi:MAG: hypothetical protein K6A94_00415 [Bacteroidales bacterium]|nr:hypothetical protein [Bacteroidales bacterium]
MKNPQKTIKTLAMSALVLLSLSLTSCEFMMGMVEGMAAGMAGYGSYGYGYGPGVYTPSYGGTTVPSYKQQSIQTQVQGTANFNQQMNQVMQNNMNAISNMPAPTTAPIMVPQTTSTSSSSSNNSSSSHQVKKPHADYKDCHICHGSGVCSTCGGKGWYNNPYGTGRVECSNCSKTGKCRTCNGTGKVLGPTKWD